MSTEFKFVNGQGDEDHAKKLADATADGYKIRLMTVNPSHVGTESNEYVIVLMEKEK